MENLPLTTPELPQALETPKKRPGKLVTIAIITALVLLGAGGAWYMMFVYNAPRCLTADDYASLTGVAYADQSFSPKDNFYSAVVEFSAEKPTEAEPDSSGATTIGKIGEFAKKHPNKPIVVTIDSEYPESGSEELAAERLANIVSSLVAAGVPESSIVKNDPVPQQSEDETSEAVSLATLRVTSSETCQ